MQYIVASQAKESGFSVVWLLTEKQLFEFFHEDAHQQIKDGLLELPIKETKFFVYTQTEKYMVSIPVLPFYMVLGLLES